MGKRVSAPVDWAIGVVVLACVIVPWGLYADRNPDGSMNWGWFAGRAVAVVAATLLIRAIWQRFQRRAEK